MAGAGWGAGAGRGAGEVRAPERTWSATPGGPPEDTRRVPWGSTECMRSTPLGAPRVHVESLTGAPTGHGEHRVPWGPRAHSEKSFCLGEGASGADFLGPFPSRSFCLLSAGSLHIGSQCGILCPEAHGSPTPEPLHGFRRPGTSPHRDAGPSGGWPSHDPTF